jgi:hypothetical protein
MVDQFCDGLKEALKPEIINQESTNLCR